MKQHLHPLDRGTNTYFHKFFTVSRAGAYMPAHVDGSGTTMYLKHTEGRILRGRWTGLCRSHALGPTLSITLHPSTCRGVAPLLVVRLG